MSLITEFRPLYTILGGSYAIMDFPIEGGSTTSGSGGQDFTPGQVVVLNADARVQEAKDGAATVLGIAADAARIDGTSLVQDVATSVLLFDRNTVFEAVPTTPANVVSRLNVDGGNSDVWANTMDFNRTADTFAGVHTVDENASADDLFSCIDIDLTTNRVRVHILGTVECQYLAHQSAVSATAVTSVITGWADLGTAADA